jgi:hypothetical protein
LKETTTAGPIAQYPSVVRFVGRHWVAGRRCGHVDVRGIPGDRLVCLAELLYEPDTKPSRDENREGHEESRGQSGNRTGATDATVHPGPLHVGELLQDRGPRSHTEHEEDEAGGSENRCTKIALQALPSGLRVASSDWFGGFFLDIFGACTASPITTMIRSAAVRNHLIVVSRTSVGTRSAVPSKTASATKFSRASTNDQGCQADAGQPPPPASFHKEHYHQAEQGVRRDEPKVKRYVGAEETHEPLAIRERPVGPNHNPALLALAKEHNRPEERGQRPAKPLGVEYPLGLRVESDEDNGESEAAETSHPIRYAATFLSRCDVSKPVTGGLAELGHLDGDKHL